MGKLTFNKQDGFTIVELLIVLVLLGLVLALGYMYFGFGFGTFVRGERQSIAQQSIRQSADFITSELRYADEIILNPADLNESGYYYILQDGTTVRYYYIDNSGSKIQDRILLNSNVDEIDYEIVFLEDTFLTQANYKLILKFILTANGDLYSLDTKVNILNLNDANKYQHGGGEPSSIIKFKKPFFN